MTSLAAGNPNYTKKDKEFYFSLCQTMAEQLRTKEVIVKYLTVKGVKDHISRLKLFLEIAEKTLADLNFTEESFNELTSLVISKKQAIAW